ncbi:MAG TPA: SpoIIIAC/SpoIIIAD family protein [Clostridia bacterium]|nr:SpoIIIAC/SpoIIIAD family protein [Clostridia bacterium]
MTFIKIIAITIITAILALIIKQVKPEYAIFVQLGGITIIAMFSISYFSELSQTAYSIIDVSGININFFKLLIKALIISVTAEIAADICRDSDSKALAGNIELAAKIVIISMSVPIIKEVAEIAVGLING